MKPFGQRRAVDGFARYYNKRLSRCVSNFVPKFKIFSARRSAENAFGILTNRFRLFNEPICCELNTARDLIAAAIILHNFLREREIARNEDITNLLPSNQSYYLFQLSAVPANDPTTEHNYELNLGIQIPTVPRRPLLQEVYRQRFAAYFNAQRAAQGE